MSEMASNMRDGMRDLASEGAYGLCPFTAIQWQELEQQALAYKYIVSGMPLPPDLISTVITSLVSSSTLFPYNQPQHPPSTVGWGHCQLGYGRYIDPEPGRCRRTDGKKWRCSKEACPNFKYCEKHINRGKSSRRNKFNPFIIPPQTHLPLSLQCLIQFLHLLAVQTTHLRWHIRVKRPRPTLMSLRTQLLSSLRIQLCQFRISLPRCFLWILNRTAVKQTRPSGSSFESAGITII